MRAEKGGPPLKRAAQTWKAIYAVLEQQGVVLLGPGDVVGGGIGVRLRGDVPIENRDVVLPLWCQLAAARHLAGWSQLELATETGVSDATVRRAEDRNTANKTRRENLETMAIALTQRAGVIFLGNGEVIGGGVGVRFREGVGPMDVKPLPPRRIKAGPAADPDKNR
jgi:DNA-binding XRE family transcriptional regulator